MNSLLTTEDVAEYFRMDVVTVRRMISKGELTAYRVGGEYRFKQEDIDEYLERQRIPARQDLRGPFGKLTRHVGKLVTLGSMQVRVERFTKRAGNALALAQEEAGNLNHTYIGTEHLLLGLLREAEGVGAHLLNEYGCTLEKMRQAVRDQVGAGPTGESAPGEMSLTPRLKKVLELAVEEAKGLEHAYIGTEHMVLAILREGEGVAGRLLRESGMEVDAARSRLQELLSSRKAR